MRAYDAEAQRLAREAEERARRAADAAATGAATAAFAVFAALLLGAVVAIIGARAGARHLPAMRMPRRRGGLRLTTEIGPGFRLERVSHEGEGSHMHSKITTVAALVGALVVLPNVAPAALRTDESRTSATPCDGRRHRAARRHAGQPALDGDRPRRGPGAGPNPAAGRHTGQPARHRRRPRRGPRARHQHHGRQLHSASRSGSARDGTPGNPPSTATGRAVDRAQGQTPRPDGTPGNPPGTAAGRATDRALGPSR